MKVELDIKFSESFEPTAPEQRELSLLRARCLDKDGFEPYIHLNTGTNVLKSFKPWLFAKAVGEDGSTRIAGAACVLFPTNNEAEISACTDPLFRRQGIFALLFKRAIDSLRHASITKALLVSNARLSYGKAIASKLGIKRSYTERTMALTFNTFVPVPIITLTPSIRLVPITTKNLEEASRLTADIFQEPLINARSSLQSRLNDSLWESFLAISPIGTVGMASLSREDELFVLHRLGVVSEWRRNGYGKVILNTVLEMLKKRGAISLSIDLDEHNEAAIALYEFSGFKVTSLTEYWRIDITGASGLQPF